MTFHLVAITLEPNFQMHGTAYLYNSIALVLCHADEDCEVPVGTVMSMGATITNDGAGSGEPGLYLYETDASGNILQEISHRHYGQQLGSGDQWLAGKDDVFTFTEEKHYAIAAVWIEGWIRQDTSGCG